jgi:Ca2+-binding EF-hand superfamily protein
LQDTINACKLSPAEVKAMMDMIDIKQKGFLDLDDVYELVGKVTEEELFAIFKFLDTSRNG